uniref:alpha,alpha-trehalose-phosphate synthase (UDP-forming) n=1 Tax=Caenorhabditis tropicalis TaxID=1561998 RepID=A0A1I7U0B2_9PELO
MSKAAVLSNGVEAEKVTTPPDVVFSIEGEPENFAPVRMDPFDRPKSDNDPIEDAVKRCHKVLEKLGCPFVPGNKEGDLDESDELTESEDHDEMAKEDEGIPANERRVETRKMDCTSGQLVAPKFTEKIETMSSASESSEDNEYTAIFKYTIRTCHAIWKKRQKNSEIALKGLMIVLELCLSQPSARDELFSALLETLGFNTVAFWKSVVSLIYDSDLTYGTQYREALLFSMVLYDVNHGKNRLRELYASIPGFRQSMLGVRAKQFGEKYRHLQMKNARSRASSRMSSKVGSEENLPALSSVVNDVFDEEEPPIGNSLIDVAHDKQRVINVSNAPPVSISRKTSGSWEIKQGSGGLVACVDPVMSADKKNIWLSNLGVNMQEELKEHSTTTNSIGLPLIKQACAGEVFCVLERNEKKELTPKQQAVESDMSLLSVLNTYNKHSYQLNPVVVNQDDYNTYYGGISNGLLWPALHNLPQYISTCYDDQDVLREQWCAYVRVNYLFSINAARNSRAQDFIWIHDYHLMLCGQIMRSLETSLDIGFFLHIPFQPPANFMTKYKTVADPIIRALLRFTKVGFQTSRDRETFVKLVAAHVKRTKIEYDSRLDRYTIEHDGWTCSLGVFPVSIKIADFVNIAKNPQTVIEAEDIKKQIMGKSGPNGQLFFSVERFDYTKGIAEKLRAWQRYFEKYPDRIGKDVLLQVAVTNRRSVDSYRQYQDDVMALADLINQKFKSEEYPEWKPVIFETDGLPRSRLIAHYLAMDIGVVTPSKDGMNLVAKEMLVCNPTASLVLSTGAGTEVQLSNAQFYSEQEGKCYHRVEDIANAEAFADNFFAAATESTSTRNLNGEKINQFLCVHDIDEWSDQFLDPKWTHEVISQCEVKQLGQFYNLMSRTAQVRRQIVECVLKGLPIRPHFGYSLENAKNSLETSCNNGTKLTLEADEESGEEKGFKITYDIRDELSEMEKDLAFLAFIQSDEYENAEEFIKSIGSFYEGGPVLFKNEVKQAAEVLQQGIHYNTFFTDRDGTLKSYACSYPTSVQPAYSAVIQAQFARRCATFCAIVTTAPLLHTGILEVATIPEGYYAYGASAGREWYLNPAQQFKDRSFSVVDLTLMNKVFELIEELLEKPEFRTFKWIGSGIQKHCGHITIAKQDVNGTIPTRKVTRLHEQLVKIVNDFDPNGTTLTMRESDLDFKIYVKAKLKGRIFNKGHGIRLVKEKLNPNMSKGNCLVCGDSESDIPMLEECLKLAGSKVYTIWVTADKSLQEKVNHLCERYGCTHVHYVSCPQVLLGAMAYATAHTLVNEKNRKSDFYYDSDTPMDQEEAVADQ